MYILEDSFNDIIGFDENGVIGFYRTGATAVTFDKYEEASAFIEYLKSIGKNTDGVEISRL